MLMTIHLYTKKDIHDLRDWKGTQVFLADRESLVPGRPVES